MTELVEIEHIPWAKVHEYLMDIGASLTRDQFQERVVSSLQRLIPFDVAGVLADTAGPILHQIGASENTFESYQSYYRFRLPWLLDPPVAPPPSTNGALNTDWRTVSYRDSEFVTDFIIPIGNTKSLISVLPECRLGVALHRSRLAADFTDLECAILTVVSPHIQNFSNCFDKITRLSRPLPTTEEILDRHPGLSNREAAVGALLCQGLTFAEMATSLFISRRTVETHVKHLYDKLNVHDRRTAIGRLATRAQAHALDQDRAT